MLVRNPASLGIENQRTKCVKMFRSNCIDFSPTTTMYYAYSTIKPLIRARSVVQVHPGPPFKSPVNTRRFSLFPFRGISLKKPICQLFANLRIGRMALHSGVKTLRVKAEPLESIGLCREDVL